MADAGTTRSNSQVLLVLGAGVLMLACGAGAYLVVRDPAASGGTAASTTAAVITTVPDAGGYTLDAPLFSLVLPGLPEEAPESSVSGAATIPATRWTYATETDRLVVYIADYSQVVATGTFDVQALFDSIVAAGANVEGATMPTNESITVGTDLARRAAINAGGSWTYLTLVWHGSNLLAVVSDTPAAQPPPAYSTAVDSLVWKA